jgi:hypothetical protein
MTGSRNGRSIPKLHHRFSIMEIWNGLRVPANPKVLRYGLLVWTFGFDIFWANQNAPCDGTGDPYQNSITQNNNWPTLVSIHYSSRGVLSPCNLITNYLHAAP